MRITLKEIKKIIFEELLESMFASSRSKPYELSGHTWEKGDVLYYFTTDQDKGGLKYKVKFEEDNSWDEYRVWEISFNLADRKQYDTTMKFDSRVLPTVFEAIKKFVRIGNEIASTEDEVYITFFGTPGKKDKGDTETKRTRLYKRFLPKGTKVVEDDDNNVTFAIDRDI